MRCRALAVAGAATLLGLGWAASCAPAPNRVKVDRSVDFARYESYSWRLTDFIREVRETVDRELELRGLIHRPSGGDLLMLDEVGTKDEWGEDNIAIYRTPVATITIAAFDPISGDTVWVATTKTNLADRDAAGGRIRGALERLMETFPRPRVESAARSGD